MVQRRIARILALFLFGWTLSACAAASKANVSISIFLSSKPISTCGIALSIQNHDDVRINYSVDWADGHTEQFVADNGRAELQHIYSADGDYLIIVTGYYLDPNEHGVSHHTVTVSGCTQISTPTPAPSPTAVAAASCESQFGFKPNDTLFTSLDPAGYLWLSTEPSASAPHINGSTDFSEGSWSVGPAVPVYVRDGPVCADGSVWLKLQDYYDASILGWTPESYEGVTYLLQCGAADPCKARMGEAGPPAGGWNP